MDKQTGKLIARISENLPDLKPCRMQALIDDPKGLQEALRQALCPVGEILMTTDGRSGEQFITDLEEKRFRLGDYAKELLRSDKFIVTNRATYTLAVIMGDEFGEVERTIQNVRTEAKKRGYVSPSVEVVPYLRELISDYDLKKMGLSALIVMHEPITSSDSYLNVLGIDRRDDGHCLRTYVGNPDGRWFREFGFVFLVPRK